MGANNKFTISLLVAALMLSTYTITCASHKKLVKESSTSQLLKIRNSFLREVGDTSETAISGDTVPLEVEASETSVADLATAVDLSDVQVSVTEVDSLSSVAFEGNSTGDVVANADVISVEVANEPVATIQEETAVNKVDTIIAMLRNMQESFDGDIALYQTVCNDLEEMLTSFNVNEEIRRNFFETIMHWLTNTDDSLANLQNAYNELQQKYSDSMEEKDIQIQVLQNQLAVVQRDLEQEKTSMADVIAQLHDSYDNLQSSYDILTASNDSDRLALAEPITALSDRYHTMIKERDQSLVFIKNLKQVIKEYFNNDRQVMNYINDKLQQ